jgi:hypothetical protein
MVGSAAHAHAEEPPTALLCMARHYGLATAFAHDNWHLVLPSGKHLLFDDRVAKTFAQMLEAPDVQDALAMRYTAGALAIVTIVDHDPGRVRIDPLLGEVYGRRQDLIDVTFFDQKVRVHKRLQEPLQQVEAHVRKAMGRRPGLAKYLRALGGGYNPRLIAGTTRKSAHTYGIALDLNARFGHYWRWDKPNLRRWRNEVPGAIVDAFEASGFIWGGRWYHYDTLHFEYRPELLDGQCHAPG